MTDAERCALEGLVRQLLGAAAGGFDPAALPAALVRRHLLGPLAHRAGSPQFRNDHIASGLQAERRARDLVEVLEALGRVEATPILLKGIAYAGTIYPDPADRPMSDIDLMVRPEAFDRAAGALRRLGYWHAGGGHQLSPAHHAVTFKRRDGAIDLHRHIVQAGRTRIELAAVWRDAGPAHVAGALRPAPLHEYLLHVAHMARHELSVPLINFVDAARLAVPRAGPLATRWELARSLDAVEGALAQLRAGRGRLHAWSPSTRALLLGDPGPRWLQIARKLAYIDTLGGVVGLAETTARGILARSRRSSS